MTLIEKQEGGFDNPEGAAELPSLLEIIHSLQWLPQTESLHRCRTDIYQGGRGVGLWLANCEIQSCLHILPFLYETNLFNWGEWGSISGEIMTNENYPARFSS